LHLSKHNDTTWPNPRDPAVVVALGAVGLLTALLAALNYVNLATAQAALRAREAALRKVMGATGSGLVVQFLGEALAVAVLAGLLALGLSELALPFVDAATGLPLKLHYLGPGSIAVPMSGAVLAIGLGAGAHPALVLSRFQPAAVLASSRSPGGGRPAGRLREGLVFVQFAVAIAFLIGTAVIAGETRFLRQVDLGWRPEGLIVVDSFEYPGLTEAQHASLLAAWRGLPHVTGVSSANRGPGDVNMGEGDLFKRPGAVGKGQRLDFLYVAPGFFTTFGSRLIAGRWLGEGDGLHRPPHAVVLNASAVKALGFTSPGEALGRTILHQGDGGGEDALSVVGVSADMRFHSPKEAVHPSLYYVHTDEQDRLTADDDFLDERAAIRFSGADPQAVLGAVKAAWRRIAPDAPFIADTAGDDMEPYFRAEARTGRLFTFGAVMATAIACLGLFGLASFSAARRAREIGVRKTLGASTRDLLRLLMGQMLRPVLAASLVAWPAAFFVMQGWLSGFDQRIALGPAYFVAATGLALAVAGLTVLAHAWRLARAEPGRALREG
jgi:putative ABC transport system permease protein